MKLLFVMTNNFDRLKAIKNCSSRHIFEDVFKICVLRSERLLKRNLHLYLINLNLYLANLHLTNLQCRKKLMGQSKENKRNG